jgi:putative FmdB family regulatory protein
MPIYEYECTKCGNKTEAWQKFSDPPLSECDLCSGKMKKVMSQNSFHLKGSGWYVTDYASGHSGNVPSKENSDEGPANKKEEKVTKAKPKEEASSSSNKKDKD